MLPRRPRRPAKACDHYDDGLMEDFGSLADFFCDGGESTEIFSSAKAAIDAGWDFVTCVPDGCVLVNGQDVHFVCLCVICICAAVPA